MNIVLTGGADCKTSDVGRKLAEALWMDFVEIDGAADRSRLVIALGGGNAVVAVAAMPDLPDGLPETRVVRLFVGDDPAGEHGTGPRLDMTYVGVEEAVTRLARIL